MNEYTLKIFKSRKVLTPTKAWDAAGWDLYVPSDLSLSDFVEEIKKKQVTNCQFEVFSNRDNKIYLVKFILEGQKIVCEDKKYFINQNSQFVNMIFDKTTVISKIYVDKQGKILIPSGIHENLDTGIFSKVENKSGVASKKGFTILANVIDNDYEGQIHINLVNTSDKKQIISANQKLVQLLHFFQPQFTRC